MTVDEALGLKVGDVIIQSKTNQSFEVIGIITESRDPPEYMLRNVFKDTPDAPIFWTWLVGEKWKIIAR